MALKIADLISETTTTTGTGQLTLAGAVTGFRSFADIGNANLTPYLIYEVDANGNPSGAWERGIGTYTASGTKLSRDKVLANSSGTTALINFGAGTKRVICAGGATEYFPTCDNFQARLTTESGVPVSTSDQAAQGTIRLEPFNGNIVEVYNGYSWQRYQLTAAVTRALSGLTSGRMYDVWLYDKAGTLTIDVGAAWNSDGVTRTDAIATQDGRDVNNASVTGAISGDTIAAKTGLLVGSMYTSAAATTENTAKKRYVCNRYNLVPMSLVLDKSDFGTTQWSYLTATIRAANANNALRVEAAVCKNGLHWLELIEKMGIDNNNAAWLQLGFGEDSTSTFMTHVLGPDHKVDNFHTMFALSKIAKYPTAGYHYYQCCEKGSGSDAYYWNTGAHASGGQGGYVEGRIWC